MAKRISPLRPFSVDINPPRNNFWRILLVVILILLGILAVVPILLLENSPTLSRPSSFSTNVVNPTNVNPVLDAVSSIRQNTHNTTIKAFEIIPTHIQVVLEWLPEHCRHRRCWPWPNLDRKIFHLHGLWPTDDFGNHRIECPIDFVPRVENLNLHTISDLYIYWPSYDFSHVLTQDQASRNFWIHEFLRHGSCAEEIIKEDWENYFRRGVLVMRKIREQYDMEAMLKNRGIVPHKSRTYTTTRFEKAIAPLIGENNKIIFRCVKQIYLQELILCMDLEAKKFISCPDGPKDWDCIMKNSAIFRPLQTHIKN